MIKSSEISCEIRPSNGFPRNSEGDFIRLNDGRIMFAFSRYRGSSSHDNAPCDIAAIFSDDNGNSFSSEPKTIASAAGHGEKNIMSVSLMRMKNGDIGLFYLVKHDREGTSSFVLRRSDDDGKSFGEPVVCVPDKFRGYYVVNNCRVFRASDGRLIVPAAYHRSYSENGKLHSEYYGTCHLFCSDDDGMSWHEMPVTFALPAGSSTETGLQEPGLVELHGGIIYAYFRTDMMYQYESLSCDGGKIWTMPQPSRFTSPASPMKLEKNPFSGKYYAIWNPVPNYNDRMSDPKGRWVNAGRTPIVIAESDDGISFAQSEAIESDPERGFCYPAVFFLDEKTMLISYCGGGAEDGSCLCRTTVRKITIE